MKNENKKNIALFVGKLTGGGAERAVGRLSIALVEHYNVYIFIYNAKTIDYDYEGKLVDLGNNSSTFPMMAINAAFRLNKAIKENNIDLLISFLDIPNIINGLINYSCKKMISIRVYYEQGHFYTINDKVKYPLIKKAIEKSDGIFVLSERQKNIISRDMNVKSEDIYVVNNIFDSEQITKKAAVEPDNDKIIDFINDFTTVAVGRLDYQKNYKRLFDIFKLVHDRVPEAKLLVFGSGYMKDELWQYLTKLGIEKDVMLAGRVANPFPYMAKAIAYISLSLFEGFPNSLVEAMICGLPVMHSDCPTGPAEILSDNYQLQVDKAPMECDYGILLPLFAYGEPDFLLDDERKKECAVVWEKLMQDQKYRSEYARKSKDRAKKYESKKCIDEYVKIINCTISEN